MPLVQKLSLTLVVSIFFVGRTCSFAQEPPEKEAVGKRWAVILVGLPGDKEHEQRFRDTAQAWHKALTQTLQFPPEQVLLLPAIQAAPDKSPTPLTADGMRTALADLTKTLAVNDSLWVFTLGHGNYDGKRAWFHVAGRDPSNEDLGRWLGEVRCKEQVVWLTHSCSGWFVKPLSKPGRIVIAATAADDESNETEFPHALTTVLQSSPDKLDANEDKKVSIAELFAAVVREVGRRFESDKRVPTEHAQLDDNGDGVGSEDLFSKEKPAEPPAPGVGVPKIDGDLAKQTLTPFTLPEETTPKP